MCFLIGFPGSSGVANRVPRCQQKAWQGGHVDARLLPLPVTRADQNGAGKDTWGTAGLRVLIESSHSVPSLVGTPNQASIAPLLGVCQH